MSELNYEAITQSEITEIRLYLEKNSNYLPARLSDMVVAGIDASFIEKAAVNYWKGEITETGLIDELKNPLLQTDFTTTIRAMVKGWAIQDFVNRSRVKNSSGGIFSEKRYETALISKFSDAFPHYEMISEQYTCPDGDIIDILAREKSSNRDVILELKLGAVSAHRQLRSYGYHFSDPILINISEREIIKQKTGITYFTFDQLGVHIDG